eukprot:351099-Chlamydomonas_euryale.AAC.3
MGKCERCSIKRWTKHAWRIAPHSPTFTTTQSSPLVNPHQTQPHPTPEVARGCEQRRHEEGGVVVDARPQVVKSQPTDAGGGRAEHARKARGDNAQLACAAWGACGGGGKWGRERTGGWASDVIGTQSASTAYAQVDPTHALPRTYFVPQPTQTPPPRTQQDPGCHFVAYLRRTQSILRFPARAQG